MKFPVIFVPYVLCGILDLVTTVLATTETLLLDQLNTVAQTLNATYYSSDVNLNLTDPYYVTLFIYTQASANGTEVALADANKLTTVSPFDLQLKTIFFIHGWVNLYNGFPAANVKDTLLKVANINIIVVNWDNCSFNVNYLAAVKCAPTVGKEIGQFVANVSQTYTYSLSNITVVGHSLGAHVAGFIGKYLNGTLGFIIGLDPAGPLYNKSTTAERLAENDAQYVQAIHTDAAFLGVDYSLGRSDFWPNGGYTQNSCFCENVCAHNIAVNYYQESITNNSFYANKCDNYAGYKIGLCNQGSKALMGGLEVDTSAIGNYCLTTNLAPPYGKGDS